MSDIDFTFAVARIRSLENSLLNATAIEQLIACPTEENCLQLLAEKGWGDSDTPLEADAMLNRETEKTWNTMREMGIDMSVFDVLSYPNEFHNLWDKPEYETFKTELVRKSFDHTILCNMDNSMHRVYGF